MIIFYNTLTKTFRETDTPMDNECFVPEFKYLEAQEKIANGYEISHRFAQDGGLELVFTRDEVKHQAKVEIAELKKKLADSDYQAIKYSEGVMSESEYASIKEQRQAWRRRINELEALL